MTPITEQHRKAAEEVSEAIYAETQKHVSMYWKCPPDFIAAILARWWPARNIEVKESPFTEQQKQAISYALKNGTAPARGRRKG
jgi:hypothetical protein